MFIKKTLSVCYIYFFILPISPVFCHNTPRHNFEIESVLFGDSIDYMENIDVEKIRILEAAIYLSIDYFDAKQNEEAGNRALRKLGLNINLKDIATPANRHEVYTHLGWDDIYYQYSPEKQRKKWFFRRDKILKDTVIKICGNSKLDVDKKVALAKLCYYIHIIGDHEGNKPGSSSDRMRLVPRPNVKKSNCIIDELVLIIPILFKGQDCSSLISQLNNIKQSAGQIDDSDEKNSARIKGIATNILRILSENIPEMLKREAFFYDNFYIENEENDYNLAA